MSPVSHDAANSTNDTTDTTVPSLSSSLLNAEVEMMPGADTDLLEESKELSPGIKVRAAKLNKLIEILIDSFGIIYCLYVLFFSNWIDF